MSKKANESNQLREEIKFLKRRVSHIEAFLASFTPSSYKATSDFEDTDELLLKAIQTVARYQRASASLIQRQLGIGYARAARILDQLVEAGLVSASDGSSSPREVYLDKIKEYREKQG